MHPSVLYFSQTLQQNSKYRQAHQVMHQRQFFSWRSSSWDPPHSPPLWTSCSPDWCTTVTLGPPFTIRFQSKSLRLTDRKKKRTPETHQQQELKFIKGTGREGKFNEATRCCDKKRKRTAFIPKLYSETNAESFLCQVLKSEHFITSFETEIEIQLIL